MSDEGMQAAEANEGGMSLVVTSKVKEFLKQHDMRLSGEAVATINQAVAAMLEKAASRAKNNKRSTVYPQDI